jgi:hypothetical protein
MRATWRFPWYKRSPLYESFLRRIHERSSRVPAGCGKKHAGIFREMCDEIGSKKRETEVSLISN